MYKPDSVKDNTEALSGVGLKLGVVVSLFNRPIIDRLLEGAIQEFTAYGTDIRDIEVVFVPGAFEIPGMAKRMGRSGRFDALVCLGAVIQGETPHFHYISSAVSSGVALLTLELEIPVIFGLLTTSTWEQAEARSGSGDTPNKGKESALAVLKMVQLYRHFPTN